MDDLVERLRIAEQRVAELEKENKELRVIIKRLTERLEKLEAKTNTKTESPVNVRPQSSDAEHKMPGRPEGHEGIGRKTPEVDETVNLKPVKECPHCGGPVRCKRKRNRTITSLVKGWVKHTRYQFMQWYCVKCNKTVEPSVPNVLPNSRFDLTFAFWIACLRMLGVSVDNIVFLLKTDYGLIVSHATVINTCNKIAKFLGADYEQFRLDLLKERQVHGDETHWRVKGKNHWLWVFISNRIAYFVVSKTRGHTVPERVMKGYAGLFTADFWNAYNVLTCEKQRCWVHLKRELDNVLKKRPSIEFAEFASQLLTTFYCAKSCRNRGSKTRVDAELQVHELISKRYENKDVLRLVKRLRRHEKELFTFCARRSAKSGNNDAERGIRPSVVVRNVSNGSQSVQGAESFATLMTFFQTSRLRDENFLDFMHDIANNRLKN